MDNNLLTVYGYNCYNNDCVIENSIGDLIPARIIAEHKSNYHVVTENGEYKASISGKYRFLL